MEHTIRTKKQNSDKEPAVVLCAHNGKEFDFPYIARRLLINNMRLPEPLKLQGKKPWDIPHLDTLDLWRFGDYKNYTSLDLLAAAFEIASPKTQMDGSQVGDTFYKEKNVEKIARYCIQDVITLAQVLLKMSGLAAVKSENIENLEVSVLAHH
jgi:DNA polymerase elongation subunit (family B)